jgi:NADPH:quinone reductase-like Zn-dependent oxidoreductase
MGRDHSRGPSRLNHVEAASAPVIAVTAWQMLFEYGKAKSNQTVMILGAAGNVGAYAVQLVVNAGLQVIGVVGSKDIEYVKALGSQTVVNYQPGKFENAVRPVDLVLDTVGGETRERSYSVLKSGGVLGCGRVLECKVLVVCGHGRHRRSEDDYPSRRGRVRQRQDCRKGRLRTLHSRR